MHVRPRREAKSWYTNQPVIKVKSTWLCRRYSAAGGSLCGLRGSYMSFEMQ